MKIAIHNSGSFSPRWIAYCESHNIDYKIVNVYDCDIVSQLSDCDAVMWHHHHANYKDVLFAKQLLFSLQMGGKKVFPDFHTGWHFDDKVGEKYLLESIDAPLVPSYVFYSEKEALNWVNNTIFPKVFKLRGGAGASNVLLAHTPNEAKKFIKKAFGRGYSQYSPWNNLKERWRKYRSGNVGFDEVIKGIYRFICKPEFDRMHGKEKGYVYFQDFMPNNTYDTRIIVIGGKYAFGEKRYVRENDFRASGSGVFSYDEVDENFVKVAFSTAKKIHAQSVAFDFIYDLERNPKIVEISYGFGTHGVDHCPGYWTSDMQWHEGEGFDFCGWMVEDLINS
ncbi:hypothetical protein [uncultured Parabacteroides sp.]|uniref:ATP-grasp domain-containing protein n=1 Tax=uncultured Parabacteroides sp. TaxID=512312 RepID=UPI00259924E5|nr:hypothetical protein [uncultured Parabacteroides sp.]